MSKPTRGSAPSWISLALTCLLVALSGCEDGNGDSRILSLVDRFSTQPREEPARPEEVGNATREIARTNPQAPAGPRITEFADVSTLPEPEEISDAKAFFSYVDSGGATNMVQGIQNVPHAYRAKAVNLSNDGRKINRYDRGAIAARQRPPRALSGSGSDFNPNHMDITLFSATWCGACRRAKQLLDREGADYLLRDIDDDPDAREEVRSILGNVQIPLIDFGGTYIVGYDQKAITRMIHGG
jgi:glutaredoxin 3